ncbi:hypothetical protein RB195_023693 [Necator americanus]|uniref:Integrase catalytic domain-containing protein n=1 Tax=Necator americanus TaxID=51031 RepID=A0ABR1EMF4_NECAM
MSAHCIPHSDSKITSTSCSFSTTQSSSRPNKDENACKKLCLLAYEFTDSNIRKLVKICPRCASVAKDPIKSELHSWPKPHSPWTRVHADFAGPMEGRYYLLIVDAYSKWPEIVQMSSISSTVTIQAMKCIFAKFGNAETLVTDNGTQFTSSQFASFCRSRGILHIRTPPFHPQSNGQAERFVDTFKRGLAKLKGEEPTVDTLQTFLMAHRSTPCPSAPNQRSPAEAFLGRRLRTELDLMLSSRDRTNGTRDLKMESQFNR